MADNFSVSYDEKLYTAGENDYNAIKNSLSTMINEVTDYTKQLKGIESFNPKACQIEGKKSQKFDKDEVPMGCCEGCWSGCIGGPHR